MVPGTPTQQRSPVRDLLSPAGAWLARHPVAVVALAALALALLTGANAAMAGQHCTPICIPP